MDRLVRTVREQVALGRLLPLGEASDAAWITENAAAAALRRVADALPGVRLGALAVELEGDGADAAPGGGASGAVASEGGASEGGASGGVVAGGRGAAPVGALPYGPLRITADFAATPDDPLPRTAERLRAALWATAREGVGMPVHAVDLAVTGLLDELPAPDAVIEGFVVEGEGPPELTDGPADGTADRVAAAALAVPGVLRLTRRLAGFGTGVRVRDTPDGRRVQVQLAVAAGYRPHTVARAVSAAVAAAAADGAPGPVAAAVVVTGTR
ncbi:nucleopolyhedrovirus P10 family protein [Streptomyces sp. NPDC020983]|uniref:nucleopolyhedrovirus P10 family protein n=1 Tax=Streptomyces sp. NPDC020983 TaxID=3365106 RepID=UPI00378EE067